MRRADISSDESETDDEPRSDKAALVDAERRKLAAAKASAQRVQAAHPAANFSDDSSVDGGTPARPAKQTSTFLFANDSDSEASSVDARAAAKKASAKPAPPAQPAQPKAPPAATGGHGPAYKDETFAVPEGFKFKPQAGAVPMTQNKAGNAMQRLDDRLARAKHNNAKNKNAPADAGGLPQAGDSSPSAGKGAGGGGAAGRGKGRESEESTEVSC